MAAASSNVSTPASSNVSTHAGSSDCSSEFSDESKAPQEVGSMTADGTISPLRTVPTIICFEPNDPDNPYNWSIGRKIYITFIGILLVTNATFASSVPSGASVYIQKEFNVESHYLMTLLISLFLLGYVVGPVILAPISEFYGRRSVTVYTFIAFIAFSAASAAAPNMTSLLVFRFLAGLGASAPLSIVGGLYADIWDNPVIRGRCIAIFCASTSVGPVVGPILGGFVSPSPAGWRMTFWIATMVAGLSFIPLWFTPETFAPKILLDRAKRMRKETGRTDILAPVELEDRGLKSILVTTMTRPFRMFFQESICFFASMYLSLIYATFYLFFQSFPIVYGGIYGFSTGMVGLTFVPIAVGCFLACAAVMVFDVYLARQAKKYPNRPPPSDEYRRLFLSCIAGPIYFGAVFMQAWTATPNIHPIVPILAGLPFGLAFSTIFMGVLNYLTDAYVVFSASALAAASMCRSIWGAALPLAAKSMYTKLGPQWATSVLGFAAVCMSIIPFLFLKYGDHIRANSRFCQYLREKEREEKEKFARLYGIPAGSGEIEEMEMEIGMERVATLVEERGERRK